MIIRINWNHYWKKEILKKLKIKGHLELVQNRDLEELVNLCRMRVKDKLVNNKL
jgi:hypothetical protein